MMLRFTTSIAGDRFSYVEGQRIDVPRPTPEHLEWIRRGIVVVLRGETPEAAVTTVSERAVLSQRRTRGRRTAALA
jgi:hypothetical protein